MRHFVTFNLRDGRDCAIAVDSILRIVEPTREEQRTHNVAGMSIVVCDEVNEHDGTSTSETPVIGDVEQVLRKIADAQKGTP